MEKISKINRLPLNIFLLIVLNDLADTAAQLLIKKGIAHILDFTCGDMLLFWAGVAIYIFNFFLWMHILSKTDLSIALPLASIGYILVPVSAVFFLHEHVPPLRWMGLGLILGGIYSISQSASKGPA